MTDHYFNQGGQPGKLTDARQRYRQFGDPVPFLSEIYAVYGTDEWRIARRLQKLWAMTWAAWLLLKILFRGTESQNSDQCDVISTVLLRLGQKFRLTVFFRRAFEIAEKGLRGAAKEPVSVKSHTVPLLLNTIARTKIQSGADASTELEQSERLAPEIEHSDQKSRVYRGLAEVYSHLGDRRALEMLDLMDRAIEAGSKWHNTPEKNAAMRALVEARLGVG